jgi:hypothetical protein
MFKLVRYPAAIMPLLLALGHISPAHGPINRTDFSYSDTSSSIVTSPKIVFASITKVNYTLWNLQTTGLSESAFEYAIKGYQYLIQKGEIYKKDIITIVDYSKPSYEKRLFVLDMISGKILFNTLVAHGHNSGSEYATKFSNADESHETSLGFYVTLGTYIGDNGYSLKLKGCEKGFNDHAYNRKIVLHGSEYVSEDFIHSRGFLGRSFGCPAVPLGLHKEIIDCIKDGSCLFLYHPTKKYIIKSKILNS